MGLSVDTVGGSQVRFDSLGPGDTFLDRDGDAFLILEETDDDGDYYVLWLDTNQFYDPEPDAMVTPVDMKVVRA